MGLFRIGAVLFTLSLLAPSGGVAVGGTVTVFPQKVEVPQNREIAFQAIGRLRSENMSCTATLIGPRTVLTARHCIVPGEWRWFEDSQGRSHSVESENVIPGSDMIDDIAVIYLVEPLRDITPLPLTTRQHSPFTQLVAVGYGANAVLVSHGKELWLGSGEKRLTYCLGMDLDATEYTSPCFKVLPGDSGGPVVDVLAGSVVAVTSSVVFTDDDGVFRHRLSVFAPVLPYRGDIEVR